MKFGTDGIRGLAGVAPINRVGACRIGVSAAKWALGQGGQQVLVLRDTRPSSAELAQAVCDGIFEAGAIALDGGIAPSPAAALATACGDVAVAVMVTASHNPAQDNGFKLFGPDGHKPDAEARMQLEAWLDVASQGPQKSTPALPYDAVTRWLDGIPRAIGDGLSLRGRQIVLDLAAGAASVYAARITERLSSYGCEVTLLTSPSGVINDGVGSEYPARLAHEVVRLGADAGLAVDGDADRTCLVDELGKIVDGDALAVLLARGYGATALAVTVMSSMALEAALPDVRIVRTPVGDRHLAMARRAEGIALAAENSGHVLLPGEPSADGLLAGLAALTFAWQRGDSLSKHVYLPPFARILRTVAVAHRPPLEREPSIESAMAWGASQLPDGRVFLRYSGTEPVLRVLVEGRDEAVVLRVADVLCEAARKALS